MLAGKLKQIQPEIDSQNHYHGELLQDYITFIVCLQRLSNIFSIDWDDDDGDFFLDKDDMKQIQAIRLHDRVNKLRYEQLARRVAKVLSGEKFCVEYGGDLREGRVEFLLANAPDVKVFVGSGMAHGAALFHFKYVVANHDGTPVMLGVELQANHFELFL